MTNEEALLESWRRQARCVRNLLAAFDGDALEVCPGPESMTAAEHFGHMHQTRLHWLQQAMGGEPHGVPGLWMKVNDVWHCSTDLEEIAAALDASAKAVEDFMGARLAAGASIGQYEHPVLFMQHLVWHDGWHSGLLWLALRIAGREPEEEWEEANLWTLWRGEEIWN